MKRDWRHRAREAALQVLYQWEVGAVDLECALETVFAHQWPVATPPPDRLRDAAARLARGTVGRLDTIDALIAGATERWRPERMAIVDRLILRMAVGEFLGALDTPAPVVINEALELARTFSTEDAVKFVNGMLDAIRRQIEARPGPV